MRYLQVRSSASLVSCHLLLYQMIHYIMEAMKAEGESGMNDERFVIVMNQDGKVLYCNDLYQKKLSIKVSHLCFKNISNHIHPDDHQMFEQATQRVFQNQKESEIYYRFKCNHEFTTFKGIATPKCSSSNQPLIKITSSPVSTRLLYLDSLAEDQAELEDMLRWLEEKRKNKKNSSRSISRKPDRF